MSFYFQRLVLLSLSLMLCSCGPESRDRENYGDLSSPSGAIILDSKDKHPHGWGQKECLMCHNLQNIHRRPGSGINIPELNKQIRNNGGSIYCQTCHGTNGITP